MGEQHVQYSSTSHVRVLVRVRPALPDEYQFDEAVEVPSATSVRLRSAKQSFESSYDRVLPATSNQAAVFEQVRDCVSLLLHGYNNTVLAYGQTGTGKTYTIVGDQSMTVQQACSIPSSTSGHGILPRVVSDIFAQLESRNTSAGNIHYDVKLVCSYLELYNDKLYDLLQPYKKGSCRDPYRIQTGKTRLEVREDPVAGTYVPNLLYVDVQSCKQVLQLLAAGNRNRATAHTDMNRHSSRSHAILQLWLEQRPKAASSATTGTTADNAAAADGVVVRSKMNFVDLAGSERWGRAHTAAEEKTLISELTSINNSLSALALVVSALADKTARHVPYRSSTLTHLLQDSLGGNCNTTMLVTVAPCVNAFEESVSALKFADRARNVSNRAVVNSMRDTESILALKEREIQRLRALLATYTSNARTMPRMSAPGTAPADQPWGVLDMKQQDALLLPASSPGTPLTAASANSSLRLSLPPYSPPSMPDNCRQPSPLSTTATEITATDSTQLGSASTEVAHSVAELESELAATRAALTLERNMRNVLEGQLQEATAAQHLQQRVVVSPTFQQDRLGGTAQNHIAKEPPSAAKQWAAATAATGTTSDEHKSSRAGHGVVLGVTNATAAAASGAACKLGHEKPNPSWPLLIASSRPSHKQKMLQQGRVKAHKPALAKQPQQLPGWNDHWQGSAEDKIKAQHKQQKAANNGCSSRSTPQSPTCGRRVSPKRPATQQHPLQQQWKAADTRKDELRRSCPSMLGSSSGPGGKWPGPTGAAAAARETPNSRKQRTGSSRKLVTAGMFGSNRLVAATNSRVCGSEEPTRAQTGVSEQHQSSPVLALPQQPAEGQQGWGRSWLMKQMALYSHAPMAADSLSPAASPSQPAGIAVPSTAAQLISRPLPCKVQQPYETGSARQLQQLSDQQQAHLQGPSAVELMMQGQLQQVGKQQRIQEQLPSEHEVLDAGQMEEFSNSEVQQHANEDNIKEVEMNGVTEGCQMSLLQSGETLRPELRARVPSASSEQGGSMLKLEDMEAASLSARLSRDAARIDSAGDVAAQEHSADAARGLEPPEQVVDEDYSDIFSEQPQDDLPAAASD